MSERETRKERKDGRMEGWEKHSTRHTLRNKHRVSRFPLYALRFTFYVSRFTFYVLLSLSQVYAQTQQPSEEQLESDLPEEVIAEIIDTTRIVLEPRSRFNDPSAPQLIHAIALYPNPFLPHPVQRP